MEDARGDSLIVAGEYSTGGFIEHDETGGIGGADFDVGIVHAGSGIEIKVIAADEDGAVRAVVGPDAGDGAHVGLPDDVGIGAGCLDRRFVVRSLMSGFVFERAVIAVGEAGDIEAKDFGTITDDVDAIAFDGGGGGDSAVGPVEIAILIEFGDDELPVQFAGLFVEAHEDAAIALMTRVARFAVVRADEDAATGNDGCAVGFGAEAGDPADVLAGFGIELFREIALGGNLIAGPCFSPLGTILS